MSNTKHTPGEWFTDVPDPAFVNYEVRTSDTIICTMGIDMSPEEEAANARLIAVAPELLEALIDCLPILEAMDHGKDPEDEDMPLIAQVRAAIAKATQG